MVNKGTLYVVSLLKEKRHLLICGDAAVPINSTQALLHREPKWNGWVTIEVVSRHHGPATKWQMLSGYVRQVSGERQRLLKGPRLELPALSKALVHVEHVDSLG